MYYRKCRYCGANLDPGESCECMQETEKRMTEYRELDLKKDVKKRYQLPHLKRFSLNKNIKILDIYILIFYG